MSGDVRFLDDDRNTGGLEPGRGPHYCPRCARATDPGAALCPFCGEAARPQGFCGVCERFWALPVGGSCPKHDVRLVEGPTPPQYDAPGGTEVRWVTLQSYPDPLAAEAPRLRLEAEGIPTFLEGARMGGQSMYQVATGGVKLQVPHHLAPDARVLLAQTWSAPAIGPDHDHDDAWDDLAPDPASDRLSVMTWVAVVFLGGLLALTVVAWLVAD